VNIHKAKVTESGIAKRATKRCVKFFMAGMIRIKEFIKFANCEKDFIGQKYWLVLYNS